MGIGTQVGSQLRRPGTLLKERAKRMLGAFVDRPDLHLSAKATTREYLVQDVAAGMRDHFVQEGRNLPRHVRTQAPLDMVPTVLGGLREGDILLAAYTVDDAAKSGLVTTLNEALTRGDFKLHKASVSHAGIVVKNDAGELRVVHFLGGRQPEELKAHLTSFHKRLDPNPKFLRADPVDAFFNLKVRGLPSTRSMVMRPKDPVAAGQAAARARHLLATQVEKLPNGQVKVHPWFNGMPHSLSPKGRGGACSTFVDLAFGEAFKSPLHLPTTPATFAVSDLVSLVGDRRIVRAQARGDAFRLGDVVVR